MAVIGITSARSGDWKRGVAANVAARLAADGPGSVAVVDADASARDVGDRLGLGVRGRLEWPPLTVVPAGRTLDPSLARRRIEAVARDHDHVVVDLPRGAGAPGPTLDADLLGDLDRLVVATELSHAALTATARWAELAELGRRRGLLPARLAIGFALVGEDVGTRADRHDAEAVVGLRCVAAIPQWWGRTPPNLGFGPTLGFPELDAALRDVVHAPIPVPMAGPGADTSAGSVRALSPATAARPPR